MAKLFVISDVHGFYDEMKAALDKAGFDPNNEEHWLISCGDNLDRGHQPQEVIDYLMSLERKVLIRGNHESLLLDCLQRRYPYGYDYSNGTAQTIMDLAPDVYTFLDACDIAYHKTREFIYNMVDYFETENYIFVHSWIPLNRDDATFNPDWRNASYKDWEDSRWYNPYQLAEQRLLPDKTLVFGHWHTSWPRHCYEGKPEFGEGSDFSIYYGDGYIGIDGCCAYTHRVNVLVIEDEFINN